MFRVLVTGPRVGVICIFPSSLGERSWWAEEASGQTSALLLSPNGTMNNRYRAMIQCIQRTAEA
jgi:hypothetical protein